MQRRTLATILIAVIFVGGPIITAASGPRMPIPPMKPSVSAASYTTHDNAQLSHADLTRYRQIFKAQEQGQWRIARQHVDTLSNHLLMGHVLYQRYMHPMYNSHYGELNDWLRRYGDHPDAKAIYTLAGRKFPGQKNTLHTPTAAKHLDGVMPSLRTYMVQSDHQARLPHSIRQSFNRHLNKGQATAAVRLIRQAEKNREIKATTASTAKARIAATYLHLGHIEKAKSLSLEALKQSQGASPMAGWVSGLTAWRARDYAASAAFFERTAEADKASAWTRTAGAYWAARAHMRVGNHDKVVHWLEQAAAYPRSFYGLIATRALNRRFDFNWGLKRASRDVRARLAQTPQIQRADALIALGRRDLAERELLTLNPGQDGQLRHAIGAYAIEHELPGFAMRYASRYRDARGHYFDLGLYPTNPWMDKAKTGIDEALVNAFIRQESRFNVQAENPSGAVGLMQLMPSTASYVTGNDRLSGPDRDQLKKPEINVQIGQAYLARLMGLEAVDGDLFSLAIAYNAGPGNLARWKRTMADIDDPLLFIEMIPMSETRAFVERVMANYWIYSHRFGKDMPSLEAVASGSWPVYADMGGMRTY